jgi:hypothetical protein
MLEAVTGHAAVVAGTLAALSACVLLQYEYLVAVWRRLSTHGGHRRTKVLYGIGAVLLLHVIEIWIFGVLLWMLLRWEATGALAGEETLGFFDHIYFSAICFTTVGFGEIWPTGAVRFLAATESLAGFVLITWSASFTYLEMERFWRPKVLEKRE